MLTRLRKTVRRQIPTAGDPAVIVLRLNRDGEAVLTLRRKRSRRSGIVLNLSSAAARLIPAQRGALSQLGIFEADAAPLSSSTEAQP